MSPLVLAHNPRSAGQDQRQRGMTLVELMVAVAIFAIIAAIAYPNFQQYLIDSNRTDAQNALLAFSTAMERHRTDTNSYDNAQAGGTSYPNPPLSTIYPSQSPIDSGDKHYNLTIQTADNNGYTLRATPIAGTIQDGDGYLELANTGIKSWDRDDNGAIGAGEATWTD
ncbi:prepilin-type N-terminal cleavage/methylation domain-containing protein [Motiliproteus coralliicola]|uniref:Prepilin-type N-terminal cleavage/methylation domain-containing protein n=1 Tax=Motiliproteus coralliicola TaxID=2283196 RepID=A0A369WPU7_9GAMM|nr:type IV pilin protein [Motiliproteus coralliicola]RDE24100.1 prepilin-type N-terminal cleavage/methylation domain-containing protein [Motiliproteus coralliicola]